VSIVVTATDTEVGKTVVSALVLARYGAAHPLAYWKPVATGATDDRDRDRIVGWVGHLVDVLDETYLYDPPVSPHLAARLAGERIDPESILADLVRHGMEDAERNLVIEGIGGLLVPFTDEGYVVADLLSELCLPTLVVARSTLGTINHTLLTLSEMRRRKIDIAGGGLVGPPNDENRRAIEGIAGVEVISEVDILPELTRDTVAAAGAAFDPRGRLAKYFEGSP